MPGRHMLAWGRLRNPCDTRHVRLWFWRVPREQEQDSQHAPAFPEAPGSAEREGAQGHTAHHRHRHPTCLLPVLVAGQREDLSLFLGTVNKSGTELAAEGPSPGL